LNSKQQIKGILEDKGHGLKIQRTKVFLTPKAILFFFFSNRKVTFDCKTAAHDGKRMNDFRSKAENAPLAMQV
jgi:uncharacterized membrane protein YjjP (DUF1212 family)